MDQKNYDNFLNNNYLIFSPILHANNKRACFFPSCHQMGIKQGAHIVSKLLCPKVCVNFKPATEKCSINFPKK
jgi:hypothetical protein